MRKKAKYIVLGIVFLLFVLVVAAIFRFRARYGENTLVVYFSRVGNTDFSEDVDAVSSASLRKERSGKLVGNAEVLANDIHDFTGADIHEIQVRDAYPQDYEQTVDRASEERNQNTRPELLNHVDNMQKYENIILIYPVWWSTVPMPVYTFLEEYDFAGKTLVPIATHKGSFLGNSVSDLKQALPQSDVKNGVAISGSSVDFLKYWVIGVLTGMILLIFFIHMMQQYKENPVRYKIWFLCAVISLVVIVICVVKLLI
ncbi:MAG: NAD(P)H-dependent oxidoreductase [Lachnospiraceae bacterium]|nr:NAD(P)H-dependent oxidoreductase [Lachnospiraceae bacterium]